VDKTSFTNAQYTSTTIYVNHFQSQININVTFETQKNHTRAGIVRERDSVAPTRVKGF